IACSRPTAPAIVSRSDSVHPARASRRAMPRRSSAAPPTRPFQASTSAPVPAAATGQRVTASTATAATAATAVRVVNVLTRSSLLRPRTGRVRGGSPRSATTSSRTPPPVTAPAAIARSTSGANISALPRGPAAARRSPAAPGRVVAVLGELGGARDRRRRHREPAGPEREHLRRQHPPVHAGDLPDAGHEAAQPPPGGVVVALLDEHDEVDRAGDQHVGRLDRQPLLRLDR